VSGRATDPTRCKQQLITDLTGRAVTVTLTGVVMMLLVDFYRWSTIAEANSEHFTSVAPSIRRAKS